VLFENFPLGLSHLFLNLQGLWLANVLDHLAKRPENLSRILSLWELDIFEKDILFVFGSSSSGGGLLFD
jgi:hypothetical protein